jgi:hypothetical protein
MLSLGSETLLAGLQLCFGFLERCHGDVGDHRANGAVYDHVDGIWSSLLGDAEPVKLWRKPEPRKVNLGLDLGDRALEQT